MDTNLQEIARLVRRPRPPVPPAAPRPVGRGRLIALVIDGMVLVCVGIAWSVFFVFVENRRPGQPPAWLRTAAVPLTFASLLLVTATEVAFAASLGKWIVDLTIRARSAQPAPRSRLFLRWGIKYSALLLVACSSTLEEVGNRLSPNGVYHTLPLLDSVISWTHTAATVAFWVTFAGCFFAFHHARRALHDLLAATAVFAAGELGHVEIAEHGFEVAPLSSRSE